MALSSRQANLLAALLYLGTAIYFCQPVMMLKPRGVHSWAQSDRLALAYGFQRNQFNLFQPKTFSAACDQQVTGVELPVQSYLSAVVGSLAGKAWTPVAFRGVSVLFLLAGCMALFGGLWRATGHFMLSFFAGFFLWSTPVVAYYGAGFLPDTAAFALMLAGYASLHGYLTGGEYRQAVAALGWLTLAALVKMTLAFLLLFAMLWMLAGIWRRQRPLALEFAGLCLVCGGMFLAAYFYINDLNARHHCGVFLSAARPPTGRHLTEYFTEIWMKYRRIYLSVVQEWVAIAAVVVVIVLSFRNSRIYRSRIGFTAVPLFAAVSGFLAMGLQMEAHDYYVIAIVFPLLAWLLMLALEMTADACKGIHSRMAISVVLAGTCLVMAPFARKMIAHQSFVKSPDDWLYLPEVESVRALLPAEAHIVVATQTEAPNLGLVYFERIGISAYVDFKVENSEFFERVRAAYFIMDKSRLPELRKHTPQYMRYLAPFYEGRDIMIFAYRE